MIRTEDIKKVYYNLGVETLVLNHINIHIQEGEFISIMGPSGCGKSTLLNIIGLLDRPTSGKLYFMEMEVSHLSERKRAELRRHNIGFIFQSFNLINELSVAENIELPLIYYKISAKERKQKVNNIMERLQIVHKKDHLPQMVSGGQQQRVAVARAVVSNPKIILADEPTGNLDSIRGREVMELLVQLNEMGTTIAMVTHSSHAAGYSSRMIRLFDGEVVTEHIG